LTYRPKGPNEREKVNKLFIYQGHTMRANIEGDAQLQAKIVELIAAGIFEGIQKW
jgi:hypothetical protein